MRIQAELGLPTCALLSALIAACVANPPDFRQVNAENIDRLEPGMSRQAVFDIMGTGAEVVRESIYTDMRLMGYVDLPVSNPYRSETVSRAGDRYEVLFYYAMPGGMDMTFWDIQYDERIVPDFFLTPVVLKNDKLIGVGTEAMLREDLMTPPKGLDQETSVLRGQ